MLRSLLLTLLTCSFCTQSYSKSYLRHDDVKQLVESYHELIMKDNPEIQKAFFDVFPDTWLDFVRAEAFMSDFEAEDFAAYVEAFGRLTAIDDTTYCSKLINLCIGAQLAADGPNYLQTLLHKKMGIRIGGQPSSGQLMPVILSLLSHKLKGELISFWNFYWSDNYSEEDIYTVNDYDYNFNSDFYRLQKIVEKQHPEMVKPITIAYLYFHHGVTMK